MSSEWFGQEISDTLPDMRALAESMMLATVRVTRIDPDADHDPLTGVRPTITVYEGKAKLQNQNQYESNPAAGGHTYVQQRSLVHFPVGSFEMSDGDLCTFLTSPAPFVTGQKYRLVGAAPFRDFETAYRVYADQVVA